MVRVRCRGRPPADGGAIIPPGKAVDVTLVEYNADDRHWDLVKIIGRQDGGAYVDPRLDQAYSELCDEATRSLKGLAHERPAWRLESSPS
jgi:hypothetical protein